MEKLKIGLTIIIISFSFFGKTYGINNRVIINNVDKIVKLKANSLRSEIDRSAFVRLSFRISKEGKLEILTLNYSDENLKSKLINKLSGIRIENTQDIKSHASVQQYRDILKSASIKTHQSVVYILLGIENQTNVHYAMPVRNMIYDALQYGRQVTEIASAHKHAHTAKISRAEYLSGFYKTDKLIPVITLVLYFN